VRPDLVTTLTRFWAGSAAAIGAGYVVFRVGVFRFDRPEFQCLTVGMLTAGIVTLLRSPRPRLAVVLAAAFALFKLGLIRTEGWVPAASGLVLAGGILLSAWIFDLLARRGMPFGKFLVLGPLLGGVFFAVTPLARFHTLTATGSMRVLLYNVLVGLVIGNGVGFGVELAELVAGALRRPAPAEPDVAAEDGRDAQRAG